MSPGLRSPRQRDDYVWRRHGAQEWEYDSDYSVDDENGTGGNGSGSGGHEDSCSSEEEGKDILGKRKETIFRVEDFGAEPARRAEKVSGGKGERGSGSRSGSENRGSGDRSAEMDGAEEKCARSSAYS